MAIRIPYQVARQIADHAEAEAPNEACGLLGGDGATISLAIPMRNAAPAPTERFALDPQEQLAALKTIDAAQLNWMAIYHSHPRSEAIPSRIDINEALDPKPLHLIVSLERAKPKLKLWRIDGLTVEPVDLIFDTDTSNDDIRPLRNRQRVAIAVAGIASLLLLVAISITLLPPAPALTAVQ